jgi:hypothetical protein
MPDSLMIFRMHADLSYTQQKVLEYLHKVTLGYQGYNVEGIYKHIAHLPFSTLDVAYGDITKFRTRPRRARFFATTEREIALNIKSDKKITHTAIEGLIDMNVIQKFTKHKQKTNYGINYFTLEAVFGGHAAVYNASQAVDAAKKNRLIEVQDGKISRIMFSIENFYANIDKSTKRKWSEIQGKERLYLERLFPENHHAWDRPSK